LARFPRPDRGIVIVVYAMLFDTVE